MDATLDEVSTIWSPRGNGDKLVNRDPFTESDLKDVSDVLQKLGKQSWSGIPRIYAILRLIDALAMIDIFVEDGITDLSFPFSQRTLPDAMKSRSARSNFLEAQTLVLTKALDLEEDNSRHGHFANPAEIPLQKVEELGKGGYGFVDRVRSTVTYKDYARKRIARGRSLRKDRAVVRGFERELKTLKKLSHIHIVELIGSYTDPRYVGIIMSPVADYNLKDFLEFTPLPNEALTCLRTFYGCLAAALRYLHDNRIRHNDIKPENVLVKGHHVYLTDFGSNLDWSELGNSTTMGPSSKTLRYCAPEVAAREPRECPADIWSLGCVFLEMWTVLSGYSISDLNYHMKKSGSRISSYQANGRAVSAWSRILRSGQDIDADRPYRWVSRMLRTKPENRCTAQTLCEKIQETSLESETPVSFSGPCCIDRVVPAEDGLETMKRPIYLRGQTTTGISMKSVVFSPPLMLVPSPFEYIQHPSPKRAEENVPIPAPHVAKPEIHRAKSSPITSQINTSDIPAAQDGSENQTQCDDKSADRPTGCIRPANRRARSGTVSLFTDLFVSRAPGGNVRRKDAWCKSSRRSCDPDRRSEIHTHVQRSPIDTLSWVRPLKVGIGVSDSQKELVR